MITLDLSILNQKGTPMFYSDIFANRPTFGIVGRIFISTDTAAIYRDTGTAWDLIADGTGAGTITGSGTIGTLSKFTSSSSIGDSIVTEIGSAITINGTGKASNWYVGSPSDLTRAFSASGNANNVALWLEEYGNTTASSDVFMFKGRGTESAKANIQVGDNTGAVATGGYVNGNLLTSANWFAEVVNIDTTNNHADSDWLLTQSYNSAGLTETFRIRASDGFVTAPNGGFFNNLTKTAISTEGWYGVFSVENITLPANISFSNSGFTQGSLLGVNLMTFQGNATFANGNGTTSIFGQNGFGFSSAGSTITINQRATGINAYAGVTAFNYINGTINGTITHLAGLHVLAPYQTSSAILQVDNYYGALINASNERTAFTITNRWGIYQEGTLDKNYFAANVLIGTTIDAGYKLDVNGSGRFTNSITTAGITSTGTNTMLSASSSTAGLIVKGGSSIGSASTGSGQILVGATPTYRMSLAYDDNLGYMYIDNLYDNANSNIYFRVRTNGTPIDVLSLFGTGNLSIGSNSNPGEKLYLNGSLRIDGQSSGTSGGNSGNHLIINLDGTTYKIKLELP